MVFSGYHWLAGTKSKGRATKYKGDGNKKQKPPNKARGGGNK